MALSVPKGDLIRPTSVMLKRRFFDSHQNFDGNTFVDICAGSGSVGLEAFSRGASYVYFLEDSSRVLKVLSQNIRTAREHDDARSLEYIKGDAVREMKKILTEYVSWEQQKKDGTILFLDPPYKKHEIYWNILDQVKSMDGFSGEMWIESDEKKGITLQQLQDKCGELIKVFNQGDSYLARIF